METAFLEGFLQSLVHEKRTKNKTRIQPVGMKIVEYHIDLQ